LVLYAQKIATISQLTVDDVHIDDDTVAITFGTSPIVLPAPLANLVRELVATRRGKAKIGTPDDVPWLFPGGHPGHPLTDSQIGKRLHRIGIRPQQDRSTALFTLATELPAAILARVLGVHIKVAVQWQQALGRLRRRRQPPKQPTRPEQEWHMTVDQQHLWTILRKLDGSGDAEFPRAYDHAAARARFDKLVADLERQFACTCKVERDAQEASYHGRITIPVTATVSADFVTIIISNFGDLAMVTLGNPMSYDEEETEYLLDPTDLGRITGILGELGYITVPEHLTWADYDGVLNLRSHARSWFDRFFFWT